MDFSPLQEQALGSVADWLRHHKTYRAGHAVGGEPSPVYRLFGYAGTGKTTLAKHFAKGVKGEVLFGAFTGKAALVLRQKGALGASTIHQLIYRPTDRGTSRLKLLKAALEKLIKEKSKDDAKMRKLAHEITDEEENLKQPAFSLNEESEVKDAALVIIDEVSMVGARMGKDLLSFETPVLVLGDPAQLPPVRDEGFFTATEPDTLLTEIHRQAAKSPVIALATSVRLGEGITEGDYGSSHVVPRGVLGLEELYGEHDIILCGLNRSRKMLNGRIRTELLGRTSHLPEVKDRLVCLQNNHDLGLLNGSLWTVLDTAVIDDDQIGLTIEGEAGEQITTEAHRHTFEDREVPFFDRRKADSFDYGYALTCHKAQGSQWKRVCVLDESSSFRQHRRNWLYTAITRAAESVTVVTGRRV